jgi:hypothetical protein
MQTRKVVVVGALAAIAVAPGCANTKLPDLESLALSGGPVYRQPPVEIYTRIARGALGCWFGASGPLKRTHVFHADVAPPSEKAGAEIVIHERDTGAPSPRSLRSFRITITPVADGTIVGSENLKLPDALATSMEEDVRRWVGGRAGCNPSAPGTWVAQEQRDGKTATGAIPPRPTGKSR